MFGALGKNYKVITYKFYRHITLTVYHSYGSLVFFWKHPSMWLKMPLSTTLWVWHKLKVTSFFRHDNLSETCMCFLKSKGTSQNRTTRIFPNWPMGITLWWSLNKTTYNKGISILKAIFIQTCPQWWELKQNKLWSPPTCLAIFIMYAYFWGRNCPRIRQWGSHKLQCSKHMFLWGHYRV